MASPIAASAERIVYRIAGLPVAVAALFSAEADADPLQSAFVRRYWHPDGVGEWSELLGSLVSWPVALVLASAWLTWRNGAEVRRRSGRAVSAQFADQVRLYFSNGILAPWYYIFSLYDDGFARADSYLQRFETKSSIFPLLKRRHGSPLNDKASFAQYCEERDLPCIKTLLRLDGTSGSGRLPDQDLFVKPLKGRGGRGAERWDRVGDGAFRDAKGEQLSADALSVRLLERSRHDPLIAQPRLVPHSGLGELSSGALPTVRIVTCLDEAGDPEVIGAVFRMSVGANGTVDNLHAGGIAANVSLAGGTLSRATNLGSDARVGWLTEHPDTGAPIEGRRLPHWQDTMTLAIAAHREFSDRVVIGWDVAILEDGPTLVEGNGNPDMDILQRFMPRGLRDGRFGELLAFHLLRRVPNLAGRLCANGDAALNQAHEAGRIRPHQRQADARGSGRRPQFPPQQPESGELRRPDPPGRERP